MSKMNWARRKQSDTVRRQGAVRFDEAGDTGVRSGGVRARALEALYGRMTGRRDRERRHVLMPVKVQCRFCSHRAEIAKPKIGNNCAARTAAACNVSWRSEDRWCASFSSRGRCGR